MDGVYETNINSPMGNIGMRLALKQNGSIINGIIEIMDKKYPLSTGKVNGNKCFFNGEIHNSTIALKYNIMGELVGNILNIYARTNMGEFNLQANKIA